MAGEGLLGARPAMVPYPEHQYQHTSPGGFWISVPLVVLSVTGTSITFPRFFNHILGDAAAVQQESARASAPPIKDTRLTLRQVLADGGFHPGSKLQTAVWPTTMDSDWHVVFADSRGAYSVDVDDSNGRTGPAASQPETGMRVMRRVHDGTGMPLVWQLIIFVSGLIGPLLGVTGVIIWLTGRTRQKAMRDRRAQRPTKS